jgi:transposase
MQSITLTSAERKELIVGMKREIKPSRRRLRMHIVLLASDGHRPARIARVLYCSRTTVYAVAYRFVREGRAAFEDRGRRGPRPLLDRSACERIEALVKEQTPILTDGYAHDGVVHF